MHLGNGEIGFGRNHEPLHFFEMLAENGRYLEFRFNGVAGAGMFRHDVLYQSEDITVFLNDGVLRGETCDVRTDDAGRRITVELRRKAVSW